MSKYILAIDQGTSSTKTVLFDEDGKVVARGVEPLKTDYLDHGYVEQDPEGIYENVLLSVSKCISVFKSVGGSLSDIKACGISNQRETFIIWDESGSPISKAVVWQCKRSVAICDRMKSEGLEEYVKTQTGLLIDPYFSGSKVMWLFENDEQIKTAILSGKAFFGTVDTWLLFKLTNGKKYLTDHSNASRTLFFNLNSLAWDDHLLEKFGLTGLQLPGIQPSSSYFGSTKFNGLFEHEVAVTAMIGDSHAAAFGEGCFTAGHAKATMGTGCSVLMNTGGQIKTSGHGMVTTICWSTESEVAYALEGVIVSCGATVEWVRNTLGLFQDFDEAEKMAQQVPDSGGVYVIPAFSGLGAPHWNMNRKASIEGISFGTNRNHIVRAVLESIPYQIKDVITAMEADTGISLEQLMVDGGISSNRFVVQLLANLLDRPVVNLGLPEVSALGAAYLAGLSSGIFENIDYLNRLNRVETRIVPDENAAQVKTGYTGWELILSKP